MRGRKDDQPAKRLSNIRRKHATPSLFLQATKARSASTATKSKPIVREDDDEPSLADCEPEPVLALNAAVMSPRLSQPLQEVSPNLSPRRKPYDTASGSDKPVEAIEKSLSRSASPVKHVSQHADQEETHEPKQHPHIRPQHELAADLAEIVNRKNISRPSSAAPIEPPQRRKSRPLGRASSGISHRSLSTSAHSQPESLSFSAATSEFQESISHSHSVEAQAPPGTQLGYETLEAEAHRRQMRKKMGTKLQEDYAAGGIRRVASLGVVKDASLSADMGVGTRVKGRKARG